MIRAINEKSRTPPITPLQIIEVRLAALLHDCGHGPFSHASEFVYDKMSSELQDVRSENMEVFGDAAGHEILAFFIVTSPRFERLWKEVCSKYNPTLEEFQHDPRDVKLIRVGRIILGLPSEGCPGYLSQIVNGPFDADKFDYIIRDGYFSGLTTYVDIDRLAVSIDLYRDDNSESTLCMDIGGATILEQLLFNKMVLFSSMYHHHKVRAAFRQLALLLATARANGTQIGGVRLSSAVDYLKLDDDKLMCDAMQQPDLRPLASGIKLRRLPKRVLVIDRDTLKDPASKEKWVQIGADPWKVEDLQTAIANGAGLPSEKVYVDFPPEPRIYKTAKFSMIRRASGRPLVSLDSLYPVAGWLSGYEQYRFRSYIFGPDGIQEKVAQIAEGALQERGISIDFDLSTRLAKWV